jgi:hypothetical protein
MRQSLRKRCRTKVTYLLILAAVATASSCTKCNPTPKKVSEVEANVIVTGGGACQYQAAIGQQSVYIDVKGTDAGNVDNQFTNTLANVPSSTYAAQVPSTGSFQITVIVTQLSGVACQACSKVCNNAVLTKPKWTGIGTFTGPTSPGSSLPVQVTLPDPPSKTNCGC